MSLYLHVRICLVRKISVLSMCSMATVPTMVEKKKI